MRVARAGKLLVAVVGCACLFSQSTTKSGLSGVVKDASGALVSDATIRLESSSGGFASSARSGVDGIYSFLSIPPGTYSVTATAENVSVVTTYAPIVIAPSLRSVQDLDLIPLKEGIWDGYELCRASEVSIRLMGRRAEALEGIKVCLSRPDMSLCKTTTKSGGVQFDISPSKYALEITDRDLQVLVSTVVDASACGIYDRRVVLLR